MDDSLRVDVRERGRDVGIPAEEFLLVDLAAGVEVGKRARLAVSGEDEVHRDVRRAGRLVESAIVHLDEVRVFESGENPSFDDEPLTQERGTLAGRLEDLHRQMNTEGRMFNLEDGCHPARAELSNDAVPADHFRFHFHTMV